MSSTKKMHFLPAGAPSKFFRFFSNLLSMACCVIKLKVWAEKFMNVGTTARPPSSGYGSRLLNKFWTMTVLPVPVMPVTKTGLSTVMSVRIK